MFYPRVVFWWLGGPPEPQRPKTSEEAAKIIWDFINWNKSSPYFGDACNIIAAGIREDKENKRRLLAKEIVYQMRREDAKDSTKENSQ